ncbi:MAG: D-tyrosyl-tRNA(Tyr) deacylase [SAR202 cluster bacterium]|jgi:D-tyrosyl-tRNA(Tyr) deacylase|nr:D-tyrosyl-tRNA(Tyr) deacylase [SAR202 cluster bacterium]
MRALIQRVSSADVRNSEELISSISVGLLIFLGVSQNDNERDAKYLADKILSLRIFPDTENKFNYSAIDIGAELLVVSQFTLYANTRRGRRPDFISAAKPEIAEVLYSHFISLLETSGLNIVSGEFQTDMRVSLVNTGPVTIMIDSEDLKSSRR